MICSANGYSRGEALPELTAPMVSLPAVAAAPRKSQRRFFTGSTAFPQGSLWRERLPRKGDEKCAICCAIIIPARWRTLKGNKGGRSLHFPPFREARSPPD